MGILVLVALTLSACAKKEDSAPRSAGVGVGIVNANNAANCSSPSTMGMGNIYDPNGSYNFESQVKGFVSATLDPQSLGTISGNIRDKTGIDFTGSFQFDSAGKLIPESSTVLIKIIDSFVGQVYNGQPVQTYNIEFKRASAGFYDRNTRQFEVTFADDYGSIKFQGMSDGNLAYGTVYYDNKVAVTGYSPSKGTLGSFTIYSCALIK